MLFDKSISKCPYGISVHRNNITTVLLSEYGSDRVHEKILDTSILVVFEVEKATDLSLIREFF